MRDSPVDDGLSDLRRLRHFIAVVDASGFTRAAAQLHLSQQALSSSVQQLEKQVGATLLLRAGRRITPTPAGQILLEEGRTLLAAARTIAAHTRAAAGEHPDEFVVGHSPAISNVDVYTMLAPAIAALPDTSFTVLQLFPDQLVAAVRDGSVDLGLRRGVVPQESLATGIARYDTLRIAIRGDHRLADRTTLSVADLADETIVLWAPPGASYYSDFLVNVCRRAGFEPRYRISRVQGCPPEVAPLTDDGVAFVTSAPGSAADGAVRVLDLEEPVLVPVQAMWQPHTASAARDAVLTATSPASPPRRR
ncbi:LysR family transcriptional regulator [Candidatus Mycobacterium wuenschmannii]|uniref:LysR family transcriptional regulator n=1 Tax=Candidatus Mycobacterium wuenschmannii TaxID=3027808 RepID=A0ABY8W147_9MYCO|nr:LysR family transcriptional regulator [Candidatus Mycobacterium wuenschmannii]WIM89281.1 LysR family transcriptional regulator [Candidatus Mycobacterium wuenschmannii]